MQSKRERIRGETHHGKAATKADRDRSPVAGEGNHEPPLILEWPVSMWLLPTGTVRAPGESPQRGTMLGDSTAESAENR